MKMIYFVGPYDLLNEKTKSASPMTVEGMCCMKCIDVV